MDMKRIILFCWFTAVYSSEYRLSSDVIPSSYTITITPNTSIEKCIKDCTFQGSVDIQVIVLAPLVNEVTFHVKDLVITSFMIKKDTFLPSKSLKILDSQHFEDLDKFTLYLEKPLEEGSKYIIKIVYIGKISDDKLGFYLSSYETLNHEEK